MASGLYFLFAEVPLSIYLFALGTDALAVRIDKENERENNNNTGVIPMSTYRTNGSPVKRTRKAKQPKQPRQKDLTKYLTLDYVRRALAVIDHRLARNDSQTAKYVLEMYFGKAGVSRIQAEKLAAEAKTPATRKPNLRLTNEFFDKLAQKYFPKPNWDASSDGSNQTGKGPGEGKPEAGS